MSLAEQHWRDDNLRADAMRKGTSGSGMGHGRTLLAKPRVRVDIGWVAFVVIALVAIASVARWAL